MSIVGIFFICFSKPKTVANLEQKFRSHNGESKRFSIE